MLETIKTKSYWILSDSLHILDLHKDLINLCEKHGAICNLATSYINIFIENCTPELELEIKKLPYLSDASYYWNGNELEIS